MTPMLIVAALSLGTVGAAAAAPREAPRFAVAPGSVLVKRLDVSHQLNMDSNGFMLDGGPFQPDGNTGVVTSWLTLTAQDRYLEVGAGRGTRLVRTYTDLGAGGKLQLRLQGSPEQVEADAVLVSPLRNRSVDLLWVPEEDDLSRC